MASSDAPPAPPAEAPKLEAKKSELADVKAAVDLLIVMDCTGSMGSYIAAAKSSALATATELRAEAPQATFRLGFVGYRHLCDRPDDRFIVVPLSEDVAAVERALAPVGAGGGGDTPEDVVGGLRKALEADWRGDTRIVLMVADAPCHGREFHSCDDSYPDGDPSGTDPRDLVKELARRGMDFYFMRCSPIVDTMVTKFEAAFSAAKTSDAQIFSVLDLASQGGGGVGGVGVYADIPPVELSYSAMAPCGAPPMPGGAPMPPPMPMPIPAPPPPGYAGGPAPVMSGLVMSPPTIDYPTAPVMAEMHSRRRELAPAASYAAAAPAFGGGGGGGVVAAYASAVASSVKRSMVARSSAAPPT